MPTTIRDVARECGVSPYTVSSVITEKRTVKAETKEKVLKTIARMGYDPAANMPHSAPAKTDTFGLVLPHMARMAPFYARALHAFAEKKYVMIRIPVSLKNAGTAGRSLIYA